ncbi:Acyl-CoA N-acyltransferases (NAT) superfamily protein [Quillaja saponaria]|uniref:Acyl-CoA N-acyltransferases (NAT) superfamily protein n=1 Tax=Quillaja saponaria TaxID=32244 RepID=A0AAD7P609_QUISA|nr:Acyl-CoA N-acyltransferases (NAT) superfamily protein [Quillaja saponaria]
MAAPVSLSFSLDPQNHHLHYHSRICTNTLFKLRQTRPFTPSRTGYNLPHSALHKAEPCSFKSLSSSCSQSSTMANSSYHDNPFQTSRFVSNYELQKLKLLENFRYFHELKSGSISIRVMREDEMDNTAGLLAESFTESMLWPSGYVSVLRFLVKQYLIERRTLMPHTATLIGFYIGMAGGGEEKEEELLAGTVEIFFDKRGANASLPTPTPPKDSPYICNTIVKEPLRRRGIGWHLLKVTKL